MTFPRRGAPAPAQEGATSLLPTPPAEGGPAEPTSPLTQPPAPGGLERPGVPTNPLHHPDDHPTDLPVFQRGAPPQTRQKPPQIELSAADLQALTLRAKALISNPDALKAHLSERVMIHMLIIERIVDNPPPGRSATASVIKCMRDYYDLAIDLQAALGAQKDPGEGILGKPSDPGHVRGKRKGTRD